VMFDRTCRKNGIKHRLTGTLLRAEVVWRDGAFWIRDRIGIYLNQNNRFQLLHLKARDLKVIGNIYGSPDLLKSAEAGDGR
jgi:hypothetical protein